MTCSIMFYILFMYTVYITTKLEITLKHDSHIKQTSLIPIFRQNYDKTMTEVVQLKPKANILKGNPKAINRNTQCIQQLIIV